MKKAVTSQALKVTNKHLNKELYERTKSMKRVITYGTFDLLHYGHIELQQMNSTGTKNRRSAISAMR